MFQPCLYFSFSLSKIWIIIDYLNPTLACQTNANKKNKIGIIGIMSAKGAKIEKTPGSLLKIKLSIINLIFLLDAYLLL